MKKHKGMMKVRRCREEECRKCEGVKKRKRNEALHLKRLLGGN